MRRSADSAVECFTVLDLAEVNVTLKNTEILRSMLSGEKDLLMAGGAVEMLLVSLNRPLPPLRTHPPLLLASLLLFSFCGDGSYQYSIWTAGSKPIFV